MVKGKRVSSEEMQSMVNYFNLGYNAKEIASKFGYSEPGVNLTLRRARERGIQVSEEIPSQRLENGLKAYV